MPGQARHDGRDEQSGVRPLSSFNASLYSTIPVSASSTWNRETESMPLISLIFSIRVSRWDRSVMSKIMEPSKAPAIEDTVMDWIFACSSLEIISVILLTIPMLSIPTSFIPAGKVLISLRVSLALLALICQLI